MTQYNAKYCYRNLQQWVNQFIILVFSTLNDTRTVSYIAHAYIEAQSAFIAFSAFIFRPSSLLLFIPSLRK